MKINGKKIAEGMRAELKLRIEKLKEKGVTPKIAIITLGDESSWQSYVNQKIKVGDELGINVVLINLENADQTLLLKTISEIDSDPNYHGLIVQRPMPTNIDKEKVIEAISKEKDVDGFRPDSKFGVPVWLAVKRMLEISNPNHSLPTNYVVLGKGETAGTPIANGLIKMGIEPQIIDSKTQSRVEILKNADVVISAVGKSNMIKAEQLKPGVILIGVGTHGEDGKIRGDYKAADMKNVAAAYTTTPGGVGPVNLTYLFDNLITAAENQLDAK